MTMQRREFLRLSGMGLGWPAFAGVLGSNSQDVQAQTSAADGTTIPADPVYHAVKRTSFGVHAQALGEARTLGVDEYLRRQLDPAAIDDTRVEQAVASRFPLASTSAKTLSAGYPANSNDIIAQLRGATLFRACFSRRQLYEVMVEFWTNHFNTLIHKGTLPIFKPQDDATVIRAHALGRFRDLLHASAKSPAMLLYLDNYLSLASAPQENYARELLELHTLGVGNYGEDDVKNAARCLTGWTVDRAAGSFVFSTWVHDNGQKSVLGTPITAGGVGDGEQLLDLLAAHPATARHIATKLCRRFINDAPPATAIDAIAARFMANGGDIADTLRGLFALPEFAGAADAKLARPMEFVGQLVRSLNPALEFPADNGHAYASLLSLLGQLPFAWVPPDGYPDTAACWSTASGMVARWRVAIGSVTSGMYDLSPITAAAGSPRQLVDSAVAHTLQRPIGDADHQLLLQWLQKQTGLSADQAFDFARAPWLVAVLVSLLISSPTFQLR